MRKLFMGLLLVANFCSVAGCTETVMVTGRITVAGNTPFTYTRVLTETNTEYKLVGPKADLLREKWQGQQVTLEGRIIKQAIGPGFPAELEVEKIIEQE